MSSSVAGVTEGDYRLHISWINSVLEKLANYLEQGHVWRIHFCLKWSNCKAQCYRMDGKMELITCSTDGESELLSSSDNIMPPVIAHPYLSLSFQSEATYPPPRTQRQTWWSSMSSKRLSESSLLGSRSIPLLWASQGALYVMMVCYTIYIIIFRFWVFMPIYIERCSFLLKMTFAHWWLTLICVDKWWLMTPSSNTSFTRRSLSSIIVPRTIISNVHTITEVKTTTQRKDASRSHVI